MPSFSSFFFSDLFKKEIIPYYTQISKKISISLFFQMDNWSRFPLQLLGLVAGLLSAREVLESLLPVCRVWTRTKAVWPALELFAVEALLVLSHAEPSRLERIALRGSVEELNALHAAVGCL